MQLLEKYRQLAHAKDEELCHQTAAVEARVQTEQWLLGDPPGSPRKGGDRAG